MKDDIELQEKQMIFRHCCNIADSILDADHLEEKLEGTKNLMMQQDRAVYGAQEHEKDLNEALKAKDSQLAVLRVRMQEADEDAKSKHQLINRLTSENDR